MLTRAPVSIATGAFTPATLSDGLQALPSGGPLSDGSAQVQRGQPSDERAKDGLRGAADVFRLRERLARRTGLASTISETPVLRKMLAPAIAAGRKLAQRGPGFAWAYARNVLLFDIVHGTDTATRSLNRPEEAENVYYVASFTTVVRSTLGLVRARLGPAFYRHQFVDIGSGKGKVVLLYAMNYREDVTYPPLGIEYDADLCKIANQNIERCGLSGSGAAVINTNALDLKQHVESPRLLIFAYNPFFGSLFHAMIEVLKETPHVIIYVDPVERSHLLELGYCIDAEHKGRFNADTWLIATWTPPIAER